MSNGLPPEIVILKQKLSQFQNWFKRLSSLGISLILLILFAPSIFFSIQPDEDGVIQRFGKYVRTAGPGLHFKFPVGIERVTKVRSRTIHKEEFGYSTIRPGIRTEYDRDSPQSDPEATLLLTGDLNVADVEWIVQYRIADPRAYLFNVRHVQTNIRDLSEAVMRQIIGDREVTEVLTYGRLEIEEQSRERLQEILTKYQTGIDIVTIKLQDVNPPGPVKPSFNEVNAAKQESDQLVNEAWKAYNKVIPEARGKAAKTIQEAEGYAIERINNAKGDAKRFTAMQAEYAKAPRVTKKRLYLEALNQVLARVDRVFVVDPDIKSIVPLLQLNKEAPKEVEKVQ